MIRHVHRTWTYRKRTTAVCRQPPLRLARPFVRYRAHPHPAALVVQTSSLREDPSRTSLEDTFSPPGDSCRENVACISTRGSPARM